MAEGPGPEPVVVLNVSRPEPLTEPVAMVGGKPKIWLEPFSVNIEEYCGHTRDCLISYKRESDCGPRPSIWGTVPIIDPYRQNFDRAHGHSW